MVSLAHCFYSRHVTFVSLVHLGFTMYIRTEQSKTFIHWSVLYIVLPLVMSEIKSVRLQQKVLRIRSMVVLAIVRLKVR